MTADIHLDALCREKYRSGDKTREKASNPEARARDGGECVIMVTTATACRPGGAGGAWRKVRRLRCS